jgi:hypothetical protein
MDMWNKCRGYVVGAIVGFIVALLVSYGIIHRALTVPKMLVSTPDKTVVVRLVTKIDTVYKDHNVYVSVPSTPTIVKADTVFTPTKQIVMIPAVKRVYRDSVKVEDSVYVGYKANVTGTLDKMDVSYSNRKSIVVIHKTDSVFTNTTIKKNAGGLFIGVDAGYGQIAPGLQYIKDRNAFGVKYNVLGNSVVPIQNVQIQYSRKLF